ncbi:MAG: hypothetical protein IK093_03645 [Ruminiclostridium sp.]|nr:hypothetical protein [Ruminiclostridium sp.]
MNYYLNDGPISEILGKFDNTVRIGNDVSNHMNYAISRLSRQRHSGVAACVRELRDLNKELANLKSALRYERDCLRDISETTNRYEDSASFKFNPLSDWIDNIADIISEITGGIGIFGGGGSGGTAGNTEETQQDDINPWLKYLLGGSDITLWNKPLKLHPKDIFQGGLGGLAGIVEGGYKLFNAEDEFDYAKGVLGVLKGIDKTAKSTMKAVGAAADGKSALAEWFGATMSVNESFGENLTSAFESALGLKKAAEGASKLSQVATTASNVLSAAGVVLTAGSHFVDGVEKYGLDTIEGIAATGFSTSAKTAVDIAGPAVISAGLSTAVGAACAACGMAGPPGWIALGAGVVAAGLWAGANWVSEQIFDISITDAAGELAGYVGGKVGEVVEAAWNDVIAPTAEAVGEFAKETWDAACDFADNVSSGIQEFASDVADIAQEVGEDIVNAVDTAADWVGEKASEAWDFITGWF